MRALLISSVVMMLVTGCNRLCAVEESLTGLDGGALACGQNADCPRPSSVLVCSEREDQLRDCIACTNNLCVRYRPEACP